MNFSAVLDSAKVGDRAARDALVERFYPTVREMVHRDLALDLRRSRPWLGAVFSTGDVVNEVFLGVLRDLERFEGGNEAAFEAFLAATVKHRLLDAIRFHEAACRDGRRVGREVDVVASGVSSEDTSPTGALARGEQAELVREVLDTLERRDRDLLVMRFQHNATFPAIAEALGIASPDTVRKAVRAAQARLLVKLRTRGVDADGD